MGIEDPIGKTVKLWGEERKIIGVVRDFHFESLHKKVNPAFFNLNPRNTWLMMGKVKAGREQETIEAIEELYQTLNPGFPFSYDFLDQEYARLYAAEQRVSTLSRYFAALAILISCLGLLGLAAFSAEQRIKEIGIRKVLGSSEMGIVYLLSAEFTRLVFIAIVIALPVSFLLAKNWLSHFEFRRDPEWWYFVLAGSIALLVAWVTVGTQAFSAARVNPVKCLRDE